MIRRAVLIGSAAFLVWSHWAAYSSGATANEAKWLEAQTKAVTEAVATERKLQKETNDALSKQNADLSRINSALANDIASLRARPSRVRTTIYPGATCPPATGAELSREDAEFLSREAARADSIRAGLETCYRYSDAIKAANSE